MTYKATSQFAVAQAIGQASTTALVPINTVIKAIDPTYGEAEFTYLKASAAHSVGQVVTVLQTTGAAVLLAANAKGAVGVAMGTVASASYAWYQTKGLAVVKAGTVADAGNVYATATAGTVDDAVVAGDRVKGGAFFASADGTPSAGFALCQLVAPYTDDIADA